MGSLHLRLVVLALPDPCAACHRRASDRRAWPLPSHVKFVLLLGVVTAILLLSYQLFVRYTWIGLVLNGPRSRPRDQASRSALVDRAWSVDEKCRALNQGGLEVRLGGPQSNGVWRHRVSRRIGPWDMHCGVQGRDPKDVHFPSRREGERIEDAETIEGARENVRSQPLGGGAGRF